MGRQGGSKAEGLILGSNSPLALLFLDATFSKFVNLSGPAPQSNVEKVVPRAVRPSESITYQLGYLAKVLNLLKP